MSDNSTIEWTDATWNPVTGCTEVTPGCDNCYAKTFANRWRGTPGHYFEHGFDVQLRPDKLGLPLRWRKPRRVFVNSMSDLFHKAVTDEFIAEVFAVMAASPQHTYQLLTKRHGRMRALLNDPEFRDLVKYESSVLAHEGIDVSGPNNPYDRWPLSNVWLGVSVEDQARAEFRIPALLDTPATVRWLSCEPLLGPIDLNRTDKDTLVDGGIDWVVVGGESGLAARPIQIDWARQLRDRCTSAGIPFFFKQWGGRTPKANGRELDGRTWDEYPAGAR
jgi:protein gp37